MSYYSDNVSWHEAEQANVKCERSECTHCFYGLCHSYTVISKESNCEYVNINHIGVRNWDD